MRPTPRIVTVPADRPAPSAAAAGRGLPTTSAKGQICSTELLERLGGEQLGAIREEPDPAEDEDLDHETVAAHMPAMESGKTRSRRPPECSWDLR